MTAAWTLHEAELTAGEHRLSLLRDGRALASLVLRHTIGRPLPRPWYHVGWAVHSAPSLGLHHEQATLLLGHDLAGAAELAAIEGTGPALEELIAAALARLAGRSVIVELPGLRDSADQSPFWNGLGRHFYTGDPRQALQRHGPAWRSHVAALLPRQVVYASFLPPAAQAAIGACDPAAAPLRAALEAAGFRWRHHVTVDDGGPVLELEAVLRAAAPA